MGNEYSTEWWDGEPIHGSEQLPTENDGDIDGTILYWSISSNKWCTCPWKQIEKYDWWKPIDQKPPPKKSPKPRQRFWTQFQHTIDGDGFNANEVDRDTLA